MWCPVHLRAGCNCRLAARSRMADVWPILAVLLFAGCALLGKAAEPSPDPCAAEIVRLEGLRAREVLGACAGQTFDSCAPVIERINAKYAPYIMDQIRCGADK